MRTAASCRPCPALLHPLCCSPDFTHYLIQPASEDRGMGALGEAKARRGRGLQVGELYGATGAAAAVIAPPAAGTRCCPLGWVWVGKETRL